MMAKIGCTGLRKLVQERRMQAQPILRCSDREQQVYRRQTHLSQRKDRICTRLQTSSLARERDSRSEGVGDDAKDVAGQAR